MPDYRHPIEFGFFLPPDHGDPAATLRLARTLDAFGYDLIGIQDHPYQATHFDAMALIGVILGQTERVRLFPDVANLPLRPPAVLAKHAATLDQLSGGRFELGLGAGAFWEGVTAMGGPARTPGQAATALEEAVAVIRGMWGAGGAGRSVRVAGEQYRVIGARPGPRPAHDMGIWLGVLGPRMLALTGRAADGWIPSLSYVPPAEVGARAALIDEAARAAGRDPGAVRRIYNVGGAITDGATAPFGPPSREIRGPVAHWVEVLTELALTHGFGSFILWTEPEERALRRFIEEIAPAVRERVAAARG